MAKREAEWVGASSAEDASTYVLTPRDEPYLVSVNRQLVKIMVVGASVTAGDGDPQPPKPAPTKPAPIVVKTKAARAVSPR